MLEEEYSFNGDIPGYIDCDIDYDAGGSSDKELDEIRLEIERQKRLESRVKGARPPSRAPSVIDANGIRQSSQNLAALSIEEDGSKSPFVYTPPDTPSSTRTDSPLLRDLVGIRGVSPYMSAGEDELPRPRFGPERMRSPSQRILARPSGSCGGTPREVFVSPSGMQSPPKAVIAEFPSTDSSVAVYKPKGITYDTYDGDEEGSVSWLKAENERLCARLRKKRSQTHELKEKEKTLQSEVSRMKAIVVELRSQLQMAQNEQESQQREIDRLNEINKEQAAKLDANDQEVAERELWYEENAETLQQQITELQEECKTKEEANKDLLERLERLEKERQTTEQQLRRRISQLELRCLDLTSQIAMGDSMV